MIVNKAFRFRIYPTQAQERELAKQFGASRFVYNHFLRQRIDFYATHKGGKKQGLNYFDTSRRLTELKKQPEFKWLKESNAQSLQQSLRHLDKAYNNFFNKRGKFPKFKSKRARQSFSVPQDFALNTKRLHLPKLGEIKIVPHRPIEGTIKSITVSKTPAGKYFASLLCEAEIKIPKPTNHNEVGIDLGLKSFVVTSSGERVDAPKFFRKSEVKLAKLQRRLSRKKDGSNRRARAKLKVARRHEKITNQRNDFLHKLSRRLVDENQILVAEDLNVKGMTANHCLAKSITDASWSEFVRQLGYKSEWYGSRLVRVDRFFPSSKRCNSCGWINESLKLADREWTCQGCGEVVDRDLNAAQNILSFGKVCTAGTAETQRAGRPRVRNRVAEPRSRSL